MATEYEKQGLTYKQYNLIHRWLLKHRAKSTRCDHCKAEGLRCFPTKQIRCHIFQFNNTLTMSWTQLSERKVKIRKPHLCHGCGRKYSIGQTMKYNVGVNDGDLYASYWCPICEDFMSTDAFSWDDLDEGLGRGDIWENDDYKPFRNKYKLVPINLKTL